MFDKGHRNRLVNLSLHSLPGIANYDNLPIIEAIGAECDDNWDIIEMDSGKKFFVHRKYPGEIFNIGVVQHIVGLGRSGWSDDSMVIQKQLYPVSDPENDKHSLAFTFDVNSNIVPNKMRTFWDTRRGKRFQKYVNYRKRRQQIKKEFL
tara:strand:+ start:464 stop:910 length:447 start_codon:yes stop_codon:yes gene_type:complete